LPSSRSVPNYTSRHANHRCHLQYAHAGAQMRPDEVLDFWDTFGRPSHRRRAVDTLVPEGRPPRCSLVQDQAAALSPPGCPPSIRYTDARPIPSLTAIFVGLMPASLSRIISAARRRAVGTRPLYLPSRCSLAMPSRCRSNIDLRSACPTWSIGTRKADCPRPPPKGLERHDCCPELIQINENPERGSQLYLIRRNWSWHALRRSNIVSARHADPR